MFLIKLHLFVNKRDCDSGFLSVQEFIQEHLTSTIMEGFDHTSDTHGLIGY